jgi:hypothetical protein
MIALKVPVPAVELRAQISTAVPQVQSHIGTARDLSGARGAVLHIEPQANEWGRAQRSGRELDCCRG